MEIEEKEEEEGCKSIYCIFAYLSKKTRQHMLFSKKGRKKERSEKVKQRRMRIKMRKLATK